MATETEDVDTVCFDYDATNGQSWSDTFAIQTVIAARESLKRNQNRQSGPVNQFIAISALPDVGEKVNDPIQDQYRSRLTGQKVEIKKIRFGNNCYPLRKSIKGNFTGRILIFSQFDKLNLCGFGSTVDKAKNNFSGKVHQLFQRLFSLVPGEMTDVECEQWKFLLTIINIQQYEVMTPIQFRKIAEIQSTSPFTVRWWGDEKPTCLDLRTAPPKLAALKAGDRFEAVVEFNRKTRKIGKILTIEYLPQREMPSAPPLNGLEGLKKVSLEEIWGDE